jgi:ribosome-associated translation inhibitor RaiA
MSSSQVNLSKPFLGYVIDRRETIANGRVKYSKEPLLIFASYNSVAGISFLYHREGEIRTAPIKDVLFSSFLNSDEKRYLVYLPLTKQYFTLTKEEIEERGYEGIEFIYEKLKKEAEKETEKVEKSKPKKKTKAKE